MNRAFVIAGEQRSPGKLDLRLKSSLYLKHMDHTIPAVFDSGVFRPLEPVELAEGTQVQVEVPQEPEVPQEDHRSVIQRAATLSWSEFVEQTYGSCVGLGLERHEQGHLETREPIE